VIQWVSLVGAMLILAAFTLQQLGRWKATDVSYLAVNAVGAFVLTIVAWLERQWGFLLMEIVWTLVSVYGLIQRPRSAG